ncbi:hypothetical protein MYSTI_04052 [Myxococcus stipitatus DSM 14675]|uniref:FlgO domain-containing protein n=1 Tax=Myxococcus stipitatus (strain DSM 14675 / JCM 12634 / Mx s8) TaxID=1278073 RepID=L7UBC4_MYXSD|nr:CsgG/HfaB family protein [Myxococcus stipitatus]AGC45353.1 hypothetical protein MYSTI_04052 [Myxococcus stipitatus DSM 14675]
MNRTTPGQAPPEPDEPAAHTSTRVVAGTLYAEEAEPPRSRRPLIASIATALLVALGLAIPGVAALLLRPTAPLEKVAEAPDAVSPAPLALAPSGPVRICVLEFRDLSGTSELAPLKQALVESVVTDIGQMPGLRLIERGQLDLPLEEQDFTQGSRVDPETRARLGRIVGAEVVVLGSFQQAGSVLRASARFVHVETGEVLDTARVEGRASRPFDVQDALAREVRALLPRLLQRLRP